MYQVFLGLIEDEVMVNVYRIDRHNVKILFLVNPMTLLL
jgi:hypothetical protein